MNFNLLGLVMNRVPCKQYMSKTSDGDYTNWYRPLSWWVTSSIRYKDWPYHQEIQQVDYLCFKNYDIYMEYQLLFEL
jgi:hypothetical protein